MNSNISVWLYRYNESEEEYDFWYFGNKKESKSEFIVQNKKPPVLEGTLVRYPEQSILIKNKNTTKKSLLNKEYMQYIKDYYETLC